MCANYFGRPADKLKLIGVTGTNGKTTVTFLIKQILEKSGKKSGLIGTIQNMIGDRVLPAKYTTPDPYELNSLFSLMLKSGCEYAVMEVSSQALDQQRVYGLKFAQAIFTNFTQDHLDYHGTLENYFAAKKMLFSMCDTAIINKDDPKADELIGGIKCNVQTLSLIHILDKGKVIYRTGLDIDTMEKVLSRSLSEIPDIKIAIEIEDDMFANFDVTRYLSLIHI